MNKYQVEPGRRMEHPNLLSCEKTTLFFSGVIGDMEKNTSSFFQLTTSRNDWQCRYKGSGTISSPFFYGHTSRQHLRLEVLHVLDFITTDYCRTLACEILSCVIRVIIKMCCKCVDTPLPAS